MKLTKTSWAFAAATFVGLLIWWFTVGTKIMRGWF